MGEHFEMTVAEGEFHFAWRSEANAREAERDGLYVVCAGEFQVRLSPA
jgi:hypothetical protein